MNPPLTLHALRAPRRLLHAAWAALALSCATTMERRFPLRAPLWVDDDRVPSTHRPAESYVPVLWTVADDTATRPLTEALLVDIGGEAVNVNALDEVPESSWYQNRLAVRDLTPGEAAEGACAGHPAPDPEGVWTILSGKSGGATAGFVVRGPDGNRYMAKFDDLERPEISSAADVVGSRFYWAAGYNTPCYHVVDLHPERFQIHPGATHEDSVGDRRPFTQDTLQAVLRGTPRTASGLVRTDLSLWAEGHALGSFRYDGVRDDDPNDHIPHEDRRELRGARVLSALLNHWDARENNTLTSWVSAGPQGGYLVHYLLDFSDTIGGFFGNDRTDDLLNHRMGFTHYMDFTHIGEDFITLGLLDRPWDHAERNHEAPVLGYFSARNFVPDQWEPASPNPAFERMTELDGAWMARIVSHLSDELISAVVATGHFTDPAAAGTAARIVAARRDLILARYLTRRSPLANLRIDGGRLCATDRALAAGVYHAVTYRLHGREGFQGAGADAVVHVDADPAVCFALPIPVETSAPREDATRYRVLEIHAEPAGVRASEPMRVALYDLGREGYFLAGIER